MCEHMTYSEDRLKDLRFLDLSAHEIAVVTGAAVSPAKYAVMCCPFCGGGGADWEHVTWNCSQAPRPEGLSKSSCHDILQVRLG